MKIRTKAFVKFQIAVAIVTAILASIYTFVFCYVTEERFYLDDCILGDLVFTISFALFLFPTWKLWNGKNWYSLSLLFFSLISGLALICFIISLFDTGNWGITLFWGVIIIYIFYLPFIIISSCLIGLIGKYISTKY